MQLTLENPGHAYVLRAIDGASARVNDVRLSSSFILTTDTLVEDWPVASIDALTPESLQPLLALEPDVIVIGSGERQAFAAPLVQAACLQAGVGFEVMANAAAGRTFTVLAGEGRRVAAGFILG